MQIRPQEIEGCHVVALDPITDQRGFFARAFSVDEFVAAGMVAHIAQINLSRSAAPGTTRGIHWQVEPHAEAKLVRCVRGRIFDVCVDVRPGSETWGAWVGVELTADNHLALYVPPGCGHGYQTLEPDAEVLYSTSAPYAPAAERGARWDDPAFGIEWPINEEAVISEKDLQWADITRE